MTSVFEPAVVKDMLKLTLSGKEKTDLEATWKKNVNARFEAWTKRKENQSKLREQLQWEAEVVEYVDFVHKQTSVRANSSKSPPSLKSNIPLLGPKFLPPSFMHLMHREPSPKIRPQTSYLVPLNIIHPFYYHAALKNCPQCESEDILWDSWTATGAREVHGVRREERALGYQMRCKSCRAKYGKGGSETDSNLGYCFATTSALFWDKWAPWKLPRGIPHFRARCAVTHDLFDLLVELRPSSTSSGLADRIEQLHLLEYWQEMHDYLDAFRAVRSSGQSSLFASPNKLEMLSAYGDTTKYNGNSISSDMVTDIYLGFVQKSRQKESEDYCKTRKGKSVSMDNTFKSAAKAVTVNKERERSKMMKGGVLSALNELSETLSWRFCQTASPAEIGEVLAGITERCKILGVPTPEAAIVDNCCSVRNKIKMVLPECHVVLDVFHFLMRYMAVIVNGQKNSHRSEIAKDIRDAILKSPALKGRPAVYWPKEQQETRLETAYKKWLDHGDAWTASAAKVHLDQLTHVRKGCLARHRNDIALDGSRIEGSHKAWNSLQRAQPSGIEMYTALAHDFVLRRNIRIARAHLAKKTSNFSDQFVSLTEGSHHIGLVNSVASLFNTLSSKSKAGTFAELAILPMVDSGEKFGLVQSDHCQSFGGLFEVKEESDDDNDSPLASLLDQIDLRLEDCQDVDVPLIPASTPVASSSSVDSAPGKRKASESESLETLDIGQSLGKRARLSEPIAAQLSTAAYTISASNSPPEMDMIRQSSAAASGTITPEFVMQGGTVPPAPSPEPVDASPAMGATTSFFGLRSSIGQKGIPDTAKRPHQNDLPVNDALTRSQKLFAVATRMDPLSLKVKTDDEFFLFMEMREEKQWATFTMTARKWADATHMYNERLEAICRRKSIGFIRKNPRALMDRLGEIEPEIIKRIASKNYKSQSGSETFWKRNCDAVPLSIKQEPGASTSVEGAGNTKHRKAPVCARCMTLMYPGHSGDSANHKKGYCADGAPQRMSGDDVPMWPQPKGIFMRGTHFDPMKFLQTVRELNDKVTDQSIQAGDYSLEDEAFSAMLQSRHKIHEIGPNKAQILFKLFKLENQVSVDPSLLVEVDGIKYLRIDSMDAYSA